MSGSKRKIVKATSLPVVVPMLAQGLEYVIDRFGGGIEYETAINVVTVAVATISGFIAWFRGRAKRRNV